MDVSDGRAPLEQRGAEDPRKANAAVALEGEQPDGGEAEARVADLRLERAVGPADVAGGERAEEDVKDEVVEEADRHREQDEIGEQFLGHVGKSKAASLQRDSDEGGDDAQHQKRQREVSQHKRD